MKGFKNACVYVDGQGLVKTSISIENGKIAKIDENLQLTNWYDLPDDAIVLPGFIDEHIHGSATADAMDGKVEALSTISNSIACEGTTAYLATTMTQSHENIMNAMAAVHDYRQKDIKDGAELLGIHLEGPYINKSKAGAQPAEYIVKPNLGEFNEYNAASGNCIKIVTLAPEIDGSDDFIKQLIAKNIQVNIGHTSATYEQANRATELGARCVTHTFNAQSAFSHREIGVVGCALKNDLLSCEIICDLIHVSAPAIQLLVKNKPHDKIVLITDAMRAKNLGDTVSELGGQTVYVKNGEARLQDGTLAGSVLKMNDAVKNMVKTCGVSICDASDFASKNPAQNLGVFDKMGSIAVGKNANFAVLSSTDFSVYLTVRDGNVIYKA